MPDPVSKPLHHRSIHTCPMQMSFSSHPTWSISGSIDRCWLHRRPFLLTVLSSPIPKRRSARRASSGASIRGCGGLKQSYYNVVPRTSRNAPLQRQYLISALCRREIRHGGSPILDPRRVQSQQVAVVNSSRSIPCVRLCVQKRPHFRGGDRSTPYSGPLTNLRKSR